MYLLLINELIVNDGIWLLNMASAGQQLCEAHIQCCLHHKYNTSLVVEHWIPDQEVAGLSPTHCTAEYGPGHVPLSPSGIIWF